MEIHKNRANANQVLGEFLGRVQQLMPICLTALSGGEKDNAIPRSAQATMVILGMNPERINEIADTLEREIKERYDETDVRIFGENVDAMGGNALTNESTAQAIALLNSVPNGVRTWSEDIPGLVQTSLNLGVMKLGEELSLTFAVRSSVNQEKEELLNQLKEIASFYGGRYTQ